MRYGCPNSECKFHLKKNHIIKDGNYFRKSDSRIIKRFKCKSCGKRFSNASFSSAYRQKKRRVNILLKRLLASDVSMRRCAIILKINPKTVARKLKYLAECARVEQEKFLEVLKKTPACYVQLDDLITIEHTKLKPLTVSVMVDTTTRKILGAQVAQIPAFGHLAKKSVEKYGKRESHHELGLEKLFSKTKNAIHSEAVIESDEHKLYPSLIRKNIKNAKHKTYPSIKGCVVGQGELKRTDNDPLFIINHTLAMLRDNIKRLTRKTWCTTKDPERLKDHLDLYIRFHNEVLVS